MINNRKTFKIISNLKKMKNYYIIVEKKILS